MRRLWQPLLLTGTLTPLLIACCYPEEGMTISLGCFMAAILAFASDHQHETGEDGRQAPALLWLLLLAAFVVTGWVDVITGFSLDVTLLYYIPIAIAAWRLSLMGSAIVVELAMVTWLIAQLLTKEQVPIAVVLWNGIVMLITFVILAVAIRRERLHDRRLAPVLRRLLDSLPARSVLWAGLLAGFALTGWIDVATGFSIDVAILYYVPIAIAAWRLSLSGSVITVELGIVTWLIAQMLTKADIPTGVVLWNGLVMLVTFILIAAAVRRERFQRTHRPLADGFALRLIG
jgi:hypothetical protein